MKIDNIYLYGAEEVPEIPAEIIVRRLELLNDNLEVVLSTGWETRDEQRKNDIIKAIRYWENVK